MPAALTAYQRRTFHLAFNCYVRMVWLKREGRFALRVYVLKNIQAGEELFWYYGNEYKVNDGHNNKNNNAPLPYHTCFPLDYALGY